MFNRFQMFGKKNEKLAESLLESQGYRVVKTNYRSSTGEMDIIAWDGDVLAFVEVKSRKAGFMPSAKEAVTLKKQRKLSMVAMEYIKKMGYQDRKARFDVVSIDYRAGKPEVEIIKNAFESSI